MRFSVRTAQRETIEGLRFHVIFAAVRAARRGGIAIVGDDDPGGDDDVLEAYEHGSANTQRGVGAAARRRRLPAAR